MRRQRKDLPEAFEAVEFFRRAMPFDTGPLEDDETARAADQLFAAPDTEGNDAQSW
jgi:hypothetical protein